MKSLLSLLLAVFAILTVSSAEGRKIATALGQTLGKPPVGKITMKDAQKAVFVPNKKFRFFSEYILYITPKTKLVRTIQMSHTFADKYAAQSEIDKLLDIFSRLYSKPKISFDDEDFKVYNIKQARRTLQIFYRVQKGKYIVSVNYFDEDLINKAEAEAKNKTWNSDESDI